ncbi:MAG TPA: helix-turn-helix domain-containing protein [Thermoanaerobaculia bacterium]
MKMQLMAAEILRSAVPSSPPIPDLDLAEGLGRRVREAPGAFADAAALAAASGVGPTKLHRLFRLHFHTTPAAFLQRARVDRVCPGLLALGDGTRDGRRILDLALEAGWDSASAFHAGFRRATGMAPGDYRRLGRGALGSAEVVFELPRGYRPEPTLRFLGRDPESPCERISAGGFVKAVRLAGRPALLVVELAPRAARCRVEMAAAGPLAPGDLAAAHAIARRMLGLAGGPAGDPAPFEAHARRIGAGRLIAGSEGMRIPLAAEPFEGLVWAILGQQVNVAFAATLRHRLIDLCGERLPAGRSGLAVHPTPAAVAALDPAELLPLQLSRRKAEYLVGAARAVASGELPLDRAGEGTATRVERRLLAIRGLGPWTAAYVMLRALGFADCVPVGDSGLAAGLVRFHGLDHRPAPEETRRLLAPWSPHRSLATAHLWASLGDAP